MVWYVDCITRALRFVYRRCMGAPHRQARLCGCSVLTATLTVAFTWKIREVLPLGLVVAAWVAAAATVGGGFYVLFLHGNKKPSESLIMRDCEKDERHLYVLVS
jgi:hypothetical protein